MQARMKNPAMIIPEAMQPIQGLMAATQKGGVEPRTLRLVHCLLVLKGRGIVAGDD
jgi:hypothetical protein